MKPPRPPPPAPTHYPTHLPGVHLFREHSCQHHYRVWHEDWYALCLVDSGAAELRYRGRILTLAPASVAIFAPGNAHETRRILAPGAYWVLLLPAVQVNEHSARWGRSELQLPPKVWTDPGVVARAREFCTLLADDATPLLDRQLLYLELLDHITTLDARADVAFTPEQEPELSVVRRVREHLVHRRLDCTASLASVAQELGCSPAYLSKAFSISQACPPKTLLRLVRVERGRRLLVDDGLPVKEAGLNAGFPSSEKFNRAFHDVWNLSPSAYVSQLRPLGRIDAREHLAK
jgi:AraC-like DNA-binding protein